MPMPQGIQNIANSFLELVPGVPANSGNLKMLLSWIMEESDWIQASGDIMVGIHILGTKTKPILRGTLDGPEEDRPLPGPGAGTYKMRPRIVGKEFPATEDGLLEAIVLLKKSIHKYRTEGICETCEPPKKRLKADRMPNCEGCVLRAAIGV